MTSVRNDRGRRWWAGVSSILLLLGLSVAAVPAPAGAAGTPGTPWTWGSNSYGQLGTGGTAPRTSAAPVASTMWWTCTAVGNT